MDNVFADRISVVEDFNKFFILFMSDGEGGEYIAHLTRKQFNMLNLNSPQDLTGKKWSDMKNLIVDTTYFRYM